MKYIVKVAEQTYEVEIEDINVRPIRVHVGDQIFEVSPQNDPRPAARKNTNGSTPLKPLQQPASLTTTSNELTAPLPGTVIEVFFKAGEQIESGQVVLIIEAMKMKNSIRSTRGGKIAEVLVSPGQTVAHKQVLVRFE